jgi:hypothetical protein
MQTHRNVKLGLSGRFALVQARGAGLSVREWRVASASRLRLRAAALAHWLSYYKERRPHS